LNEASRRIGSELGWIWKLKITASMGKVLLKIIIRSKQEDVKKTPAISILLDIILMDLAKSIQRSSKREHLFTELQKDKIFNAKSPRCKEI